MDDCAQGRWLPVGVALALSVVGLAGCGPTASPPLDRDVARAALTTFLDAWKEGQTPETLRQRDPEIIVGAPEWTAGARLVSYRVLEPIADDGSNLHAPVELELEEGSARPTKRQVTYIVGTRPKITIFPE